MLNNIIKLKRKTRIRLKSIHAYVITEMKLEQQQRSYIFIIVSLVKIFITAIVGRIH